MNPKCTAISCRCPCCAATAHQREFIPGVTRRQFLYNLGAATLGGLAFPAVDLGAAAGAAALPQRHPLERKTLTVQPVLTYATPKKREATSWRSWGGIQSDEAAAAEAVRIDREVKTGRRFSTPNPPGATIAIGRARPEHRAGRP
jgi:hypothetical protein